MISPSAQQALSILRDPSHFQWHVVPVFAIVVYLYFVEIEKRNWDAVCAGLAYYGIEWIGEYINSLWLHFSGYAPLWGEPGNSAYLILVGLNVETTLMFAIFGLAIAKLLPKDRKAKICGIPGRLAVVLGLSLFAAIVETTLNALGALTWDYSWWGWPNLLPVILFAYIPACAFAVWVHDLQSRKARVGVLVGIYALDLVGWVVFVSGLRWI